VVSASEALVETVGLTKVFADFWGRPKVRAVDGLDLALQPGEVLGLLGPNGSGKSTTVKLILGLLYPTRGAVRLFGRSPRDVRAKARVGFLPEETYLYPYLNAEETLDFYGRLLSLSAAERRRRVGGLLEMVGLAGARRRQLGEYSKGMARRIGLAQALIGDPDLVILDEPTSGMDPLGTRDVKDLILRLKARGKTVLLCSHLLANVEDVCDRVVVLFGGRSYAEGTLDELLTERRMTQITLPLLDEGTLAELRSVLASRAPDASVEVGHPVQRLEEFFLRVVREAYERQEETGGAQAGGGGGMGGDLFGPAAGAKPGEVRPSPGPGEPAERAGREQAADDVIKRLTSGREAKGTAGPGGAEGSEGGEGGPVGRR